MIVVVFVAVTEEVGSLVLAERGPVLFGEPDKILAALPALPLLAPLPL